MKRINQTTDQRWFVIAFEYIQIGADEWDECWGIRTVFSSYAKAYEHAEKELTANSDRMFRVEIGREYDDPTWGTWEEGSFYSDRYERISLQLIKDRVEILNEGYGVTP